ncbi:bifunctional [glutamate--ammonia ligase]-adenylyl-L-tyrosine phosphorylase/[glutamate--ammonia-ligase] adenylyltransferase [Paraglaciecola sp. 2405UD69-4]|uniref:bifunctional [glutamate--ammonia ligase]-adenylyl-L-tyrosine phosphorylase/[glutamate--ammonia-ligase] adenylyltransferase n=1 Tax=Paraglaciecola sp. 2405UD69-4 TaxID=3391836 RepID=UPI0039C9C9FF
MKDVSKELTGELHSLAEKRWQDFSTAVNFNEQLVAFKPSIKTAFALSDFIAKYSQSHPQWLVTFLIEQQGRINSAKFQQLLKDTIKDIQNETQLLKALREFRNFHMLCICWNDLLNLQTIETSLQQVSVLAEQLIVQTSDWFYQFLQTRFGTPMGESDALPMLILGMGKLGGYELNFSSDIDLIFSYPFQGHTQEGQKSIEHQQFFTKVAQKLIHALDQITADGQVYRVDMRLRPFGDSGPLVMHFDALEDYYQEQGREWERYAMLKARILNPSCHYTQELNAILKPFIYRRYLDYSAIDSLRSMKALIKQEVRRRGLTNNIKLGEGGIREAEFVVQSLQLINGGRIPSLQVQSLQQALTVLEQEAILPSDSAEQLRISYLWLRKVEHCLQQFADKQTQLLPDDPLDQARLLWVMDMNSYEEFLNEVKLHSQHVHQQFSLLIRETDTQTEESEDEHHQVAVDLWLLELDNKEVHTLLEHWNMASQDGDGLELSESLNKELTDFRLNLVKKRVGQRGLDTLNKLMPSVLNLVLQKSDGNNPIALLQRLLLVFTSIMGRTAYLQLLSENLGALTHLIKLCAASPWVTAQIARFPLLLDELINPAELYQPIQLKEYQELLRETLLRVEPEDLELQLETLRQFKLSQQLKIAAADITGVLPITKVSDHLTQLAESVLCQAIDLAWVQVVAKHGAPVCQIKGPLAMHNKGFAVIGFGKLGGWELGYGSDLDLVFVHNCAGNLDTQGEKPIESIKFYIKLAQRIMHILTIKTGLGLLYEVDMRLRPSGNAGLLVCHIDGFASYQLENAWTWEHQALCRARFIYGDSDLKSQFSEIRFDTLSRQRDIKELAIDVVQMREKMREHLATGNATQLDLKQNKGGIADIEFITQFMVLAHTAEHAKLANWTDNINLFAALSKVGLLTEQEASQLTDAYLTYRNTTHRLALQNEKWAATTTELNEHQANVERIWDKYLQRLI